MDAKRKNDKNCVLNENVLELMWPEIQSRLFAYLTLNKHAVNKHAFTKQHETV